MDAKKSLSIIALIAAIAISVGAAQDRAAIRRVDFKNFSFAWSRDIPITPSEGSSPWHWLDSLPESHVRVADGIHHFYLPNHPRSELERAPLIRVDAVAYGDLDGDGMEDAAVHLNFSTGGTQNWDYLYVYRSTQGQPQLMGVLRSGSRGDGGLIHTLVQNGHLVLDFADPDRRAGDCCSEGYIRVRYRWRNSRFFEDGPRERGDLALNGIAK